jgi:hypothetical protein
MSDSSSTATAVWLVTIMLIAEGLGQLALAYSTWHGGTIASMDKDFLAEGEQSHKWVALSGKGKTATPRHIVVAALAASLCFNIIIPFTRLLLCAWGLKAAPSVFRAVYGLTAFLVLEWYSWAVTWKRPLLPLLLVILVGSSLAAGYALYTSGAGLHTHYWGLANLLYIANFVLFPLGARRWMLEITNIGCWLLLAYGSSLVV